MKKYLVGGAVRDILMGLEPKDKDYVVVGSSPEEMIKLGFKQVGFDFPVFLHPENQDEYALARKESKSGVGYKGFTTNFGSDITLIDDLKRRDLTINAIAYDEENNIYIDPFNGIEDIKNKLLNPTSEAFAEDPLRVLRCCRFAARYQFKISNRLMKLMKKIVKSKEMLELDPERVKKEVFKVFNDDCPEIFFEEMKSCGALKDLFPELMTENFEILKRASKLTKDKNHLFTALYFNVDENVIFSGINNLKNSFVRNFIKKLKKHYPEKKALIDKEKESLLTNPNEVMKELGKKLDQSKNPKYKELLHNLNNVFNKTHLRHEKEFILRIKKNVALLHNVYVLNGEELYRFITNNKLMHKNNNLKDLKLCADYVYQQDHEDHLKYVLAKIKCLKTLDKKKIAMNNKNNIEEAIKLASIKLLS